MEKQTDHTKNGPRTLLYVDLWAGAAGDMLLAALLDAFPERDLERVLTGRIAALDLPNVRVRAERGVEKGFSCTRLTVEEGGGQPRRGPREVSALVRTAALPGEVRERSLKALDRLARVEAGLHGVPVNEVHFHELGAVDTMVDVVGFFSLLHELGIERVAVGPVPVGQGTLRTEHGDVGIPAPATLALLEGVPVSAGPESSEVTTPTGALLLTEAADFWGGLPPMTPQAVGYGAGNRVLEHGPNLLRVVVGKTAESPVASRDEAVVEAESSCLVLEAAIDDATPEVLGFLQSRLIALGALDVCLAPVLMKKSRPGVQLTVIARPEEEDALVDTIFAESTTFGLRRRMSKRHELERRTECVSVGGGEVSVKVGYWKGVEVTCSPEYEDCRRVAEETGRSLKQVMNEAVAARKSAGPVDGAEEGGTGRGRA